MGAGAARSAACRRRVAIVDTRPDACRTRSRGRPWVPMRRAGSNGSPGAAPRRLVLEGLRVPAPGAGHWRLQLAEGPATARRWPRCREGAGVVTARLRASLRGAGLRRDGVVGAAVIGGSGDASQHPPHRRAPAPPHQPTTATSLRPAHTAAVAQTLVGSSARRDRPDPPALALVLVVGLRARPE